MTKPNTCTICDFNPEDNFYIATSEDRLVVALWDPYSVSEGSFLVAPARHAESIFAITPEEHMSLYGLAKAIAARVRDDHGFEDYNIGSNVGKAAGQLLEHPNMLFIPRRPGDVKEPRGGVRYVIPEEGDYIGNPKEPRQPGSNNDPVPAIEDVQLSPPEQIQ